MPKVIALTGPPGSGKTTFAKQKVLEENFQIVSSDDIRAMLTPDVDSFKLPRSKNHEDAVVKIMAQSAQALVGAGFDVIVDAVNVRSRMMTLIIDSLIGYPVDYEVKSFWDSSIQTCIARDNLRGSAGGRFVGEEVIRKFFRDYDKSNWKLTREWIYSRVPIIIPYTFDDITSDWCKVYDIDGTLAIHDGRGPYDLDKLMTDKVNFPVYVDLKQTYEAGEERVILLSGRKMEYKGLTEYWLELNNIPYHELYMRPFGDNRSDAVVKAELFNKNLRGHYNVTCIYDDRDKVVRTWRAMGLNCFQVAPGDF